MIGGVLRVPRQVDGILVLYHFIPPYAETVLEHATAFERHSGFPTWSVNTAERFPAALNRFRFRAIVLHYSLFGSADYRLDASFRAYLRADSADLRIAFFQDEYQHTGQRFAFIDEFAVDWVYSLLQEADAEAIYRRRTRAARVFSTIPGLVGEDLLRQADRFARPAAERSVDVGYRARTLPFAGGRGAQEKSEIGRQFAARASGSGLNLDIGVDEADRLYGDDWYRFLGSCRAVLGVEAGVSIVDLDDTVGPATAAYLAEHPGAGFEEVWEAVLRPWEDNVPYRAVSPRHFEAAAFETCQILFEGAYSGLLEAGTHYLALRKDFSNLDEVLAAFRDPEHRSRVIANAHRDLIASGRHTYQTFVATFDEELTRAGVPGAGATRLREVDAALRRGAGLRRTERRLRTGYWRLRLAARRFGRPR
jgi:hypothetical protein